MLHHLNLLRAEIHDLASDSPSDRALQIKSEFFDRQLELIRDETDCDEDWQIQMIASGILGFLHVKYISARTKQVIASAYTAKVHMLIDGYSFDKAQWVDFRDEMLSHGWRSITKGIVITLRQGKNDLEKDLVKDGVRYLDINEATKGDNPTHQNGELVNVEGWDWLADFLIEEINKNDTKAEFAEKAAAGEAAAAEAEKAGAGTGNGAGDLEDNKTT
jgi:hypothetical protein